MTTLSAVDECAFCDQAASTAHSAPICALHILPRPAIVRWACIKELCVGGEGLALGLSGHRGAEDFAGALDPVASVLQHLVVERVAGLEAGEALQVVCNGDALGVSETDSATNRESIPFTVAGDDDVDAGDACDVVGVGDADRRLDHANQNTVVIVCVGVVVPPDAAVLAAAGGAPRDGRVPHPLRGLLRLLNRVHRRHDKDERADVRALLEDCAAAS